MIAGTGGTTGRPKGVVLTGANLEAMTAIVLMSYPFQGRPVYLALAPLTHAAGVLCFPMLALGGRIVVLRKPDLGDFLDAVARYDVTHTFLPPTLIYLLLGKPELVQPAATAEINGEYARLRDGGLRGAPLVQRTVEFARRRWA